MCVPVQDSIYDAFAKAVTEKVAEFKQGSGMDPGVTLGPLINPAAVDRVMNVQPAAQLSLGNVLAMQLFLLCPHHILLLPNRSGHGRACGCITASKTCALERV